MAKRTPKKKNNKIGLAALPAAPYNPRKISAEALNALRKSLMTFGDLSGVVYNKRTKHIVCGHQRRDSLEGIDLSDIEWAESYKVTLNRGKKEFVSNERAGVVKLPDGARLNVREVDWPLKFEKAANVAANNPHIAGEWTESAEAIFKELSVEFPDLYTGLLIDEIRLEPIEDLEPKGPKPAKEEATVFLTVPTRFKAKVKTWLANGEQETQTGLGRGVLKRAGLLK